MDFEKLKKLANRNEVPIDDFGGRKSSTPYYYDSLRHAFGFYFNTFNTKNAYYDSYALGLHRDVRILQHQLLDKENTVLSLVTFERFFELFIKDLLRRTDRKLTYSHKYLNKYNKALHLIEKIRTNKFTPDKYDNKYLSAPFRESLERFYGLIELHKNGNPDPIVKKFNKIITKYAFLDSEDYRASMQLLNWYRDRILHNGNKLPSLWLLDFLITQRIIPIIKDITDVDKVKLGASLFYFETETKINVLDKLAEVKYVFSDLKRKDEESIDKVYSTLLYIGHLKELGRANLNMNLYTRNNKATYEYNYRDFKGRGERFAIAETNHNDFKEIQNCPCCGVHSLVRYNITTDDFFNPGEIKNIEWVKCYTCDYHLRYNVGDPHFFNLTSDIIFKSNFQEYTKSITAHENN
jgi:hypothetical protein